MQRRVEVLGVVPGVKQDRAVAFRHASRLVEAEDDINPDVDGHMVIYGTGGSGKSVALRTIAASAGLATHGGPVHVYGLPFLEPALVRLSVGIETVADLLDDLRQALDAVA